MLKRVCIVLFFFLFSYSETLYGQSYYDFELGFIKFSGNSFFSESELKQNIESKETPMWFWVFLDSFTPFGDEPVYFDSSNISIDKLALIELYRSSGFFNVKINHFIVVDSANKSIELSYLITENRASNFGKINLIGLDKLSNYDYGRMISESIVLDSTKRYSESEVQNNISSIKRFLANNGYVFGGYDSTNITIDTLAYRTDVNIHFHTGNKYTISETIINKTGQSVQQITNELITEIADLKPGKIYDQSQIDRSELRLLKTELFTSLDINPVISDTSNFTIPIEINTTIGSLNELSPEIKADNEFGSFNLGFGIGYTRKNFLGDARKLSLSTSFRLIDIININLSNLFKSAANGDSTYQGVIDLNLKMEQPFLFGRPILTTTELYLRSQTFIDYTENSYGGAQRFDIEMPPYTFITLFRPFVSLDFAERQNVTRSVTGDIEYKTTETNNSLTPGIGVELGSAKTDDILFPSRGSYLFFTPELFYSKTDILISKTSESSQIDSNLAGNIYFYRLQTGISNYISLSNDRSFVFASKLRVGYAQPITGSNNPDITSERLIPPNKTFYAGGSNSIRGWKSRELIPKDSVVFFGITTEANAIRGGTFWFEGSFELRKKLGQYFGYAVFADYGNTWNGWKEIQIKDVAVAVGFGIRIYTPIAPFRLDFGSKFYDPSDQKIIFEKNLWDNLTIHFGIGEAF